jgi:hypothetical protein
MGKATSEDHARLGRSANAARGMKCLKPARPALVEPLAKQSVAGASRQVDPWEREAVTFRLTDERKRALRSLLHGADAALSPTSALDLAIERAVAALARGANLDGEKELLANVPSITSDELRDTLRAVAEAAAEWSGARSHLARVAADCAELRSAIAAASVLSDGVPVDETPRPIRAWLDQAGATSWIVAKARWLATRSANPGMAAWTLELRELGRDGGAPALLGADAVELGPAPAGGPLSRLGRDGGCVVSCARAGAGWARSLRPTLEGGKLGDPFAELVV